MAKEYTYPEEKPQMVSENVAVNYPSIGIADAIWTLIVNQTAEVQTIIAERLNHLRSKTSVKPYALEELNSRIDEAEQQMVCVDVVPCEQVNTDMRTNIDQIKQPRMEAFTKLILSERPSELDDSVVLAECEAARQEIYNQLKTK